MPNQSLHRGSRLAVPVFKFARTLPALMAALLTACGGGSTGTSGSPGTVANDAVVDAGSKRILSAVPTSRMAAPPIVLNATTSARPGDVVSLQGENFGIAPRVFFSDAPNRALDIVNQVGTQWLAVRIPADAPGALTVRVDNGNAVSDPVKLNAALPLHLDAMQLMPGGAFRLFGRNLQLPGSAAKISVDGLAATVDSTRSDEHMLTAIAPTGLRANANAVILVDNGNGSGAARLDRSIAVTTDGGGDPFALGVGWAGAFAALAAHVVDASADPRLSSKVACNGVTDDSAAVQRAIELAAGDGGGVVRLPAGRCRMAGGMELRSKVVVQGAGKAATELVYESNYPLFAYQLDLAGIRELTLTNAGSASEGPLLKNSTRVFIQNVRVRLATSRQMYLDGNRQFVVAGSDFEQAGSISQQGPYILNDSAGLVFENNTTRWINGAPTFGRIHDAYLHANRFTRDAGQQNGAGVVHAMAVDFAHRIAVVGNRFDVVNGPVTNAARNDGETILTEGGGAQRTENLGQVVKAGRDTLTDTATTLDVDPFGSGTIPENYGIAIVAGKGAGQTRRIVAYAQPTLTVDRPWTVVPDSSSRYASFVWGLEKSLIKANVLSQNPRGIWLYGTAVREVDVIGNSISEGGGIYLRSHQNLAAKRFTPIYNVLVARNQIVNTTGQWMSYINAVFVNADARAFGIANLGIEMRANQLTANRPNVSSQSEEYANTEGYMNMMRVENYAGYESSAVPRLLGSIIAGNVCTHCDVAVRVGTGAGGTTILDTLLVDSAASFADWATTVTGERSTDSINR